MSVTLTNLQTELQEKLGSTSNIKADTTKQKNALNRVLDRMQLIGNWMFAIRTKTFDYLPDVLEYSISNYLSLSDFKDVYRFMGENLPKNDPRKFPGGENYGLHIKDNDRFLSFRLDGGTRKTVDGLYSLTADGTWSGVGDTVSLSADNNEYKVGSGSLKFNVDVSNSANNYAGIQNTTKNQQDLSDYEGRSYFLLWVYLPTVTNVTSVEIFAGSDTSNYWSGTATAPVDSGSFKVGWNLVSVKWEDMTQTGSPVVTAIDYYEVRLNYAAAFTDTNNVRFNELALNIRQQVDMEYFSQYMCQSSAGTYQRNFSTGTDIFLGGDELKPVLLEWAYYELIRNTKTTNKNEINMSREEAEVMMKDAVRDYGYSRRKGTRRIMTKL